MIQQAVPLSDPPGAYKAKNTGQLSVLNPSTLKQLGESKRKPMLTGMWTH